ncbi:hypothetical protein PENANT_c010G11007 [Penicillium antarcticum]|uniref:Pectinesterase n=1 Tax=Penicillium antarcticum TaxID=416450 RepID=A0A1V6Q7U1_9EURO|nr:hypothetical protein PENANT_c010G11007 [Penicillium antarcticum]
MSNLVQVVQDRRPQQRSARTKAATTWKDHGRSSGHLRLSNSLQRYGPGTVLVPWYKILGTVYYKLSSKTAIIVASDGTGQFTAIQDGISYAQIHAIPTVTVLAEQGHHNQYWYCAVNNNVQQINFKNVNLINTGANYADMVLKGNKYAFYDCQIVSTGTLGITASVGLGVIANLYIETLDKIIYG